MAPTGFGVAWMVQVVPSHVSAKLVVPEAPTAVQAVDELHDTPDRWLSVAPAGSGVGSMVQAVPFHASANVWLPDLSE